MSQTFFFCVAAEHKVFSLPPNLMPGYKVLLIALVLVAKYLAHQAKMLNMVNFILAKNVSTFTVTLSHVSMPTLRQVAFSS